VGRYCGKRSSRRPAAARSSWWTNQSFRPRWAHAARCRLRSSHFGWPAQVAYLESLGARPRPVLRQKGDGTPFKTDHGNVILDGRFGPIEDPVQLAAQLNERAGIVEHGLFLGLATDVIVAGSQGIRHLKKGNRNDRD